MNGTKEFVNVPTISLLVHTESRHLRIASGIALTIAYTKRQKEIQLRDQLAGIYVANFERVVRFWPSAASLEDFIAEHCGWSEHRLMTWERNMYELRNPPWTLSFPFTQRFLQVPRRHSSLGRFFIKSQDLNAVHSTAAKLSPYRVDHFGKLVPMITPELFLLATARANDIVLGQRLMESGLLLDDLQREATRPLEHPKKLMF